MKRSLIILILFSFFQMSYGQQTQHLSVKTVVVKDAPVKLIENEKGNASVGFVVTDSALYLDIAGTNIGSTTIDHKDSVFLFLANNKKIAFSSTGLQSFTPSLKGNTYRHRYTIYEKDLKQLSQYPVRMMQKQAFEDLIYFKLTAHAAHQIQLHSAAIVNQLATQREKNNILPIGIDEMANQIGVNVVLCGKVFATRLFETTKAEALILDFQTTLSSPKARAIIWKEDQKKIGLISNAFLSKKDVCITGVVYLYDGIPYIRIKDKSQLRIIESVHSAPIKENLAF